MTKIPHFT